MLQSRNQLIDVVKGISILLVIVGHSVQYCSGENYLTESLFFENWLFKFIYSFHMPMFMCISGYLFYYSCQKHSIVEIIRIKSRTILLPILCFAAVPAIPRYMDHAWPFILMIKDFFLIASRTLWFLAALYFCSLSFLLLRSIFDNQRYRNIAIVFIILCSFFIPKIYHIHLYFFVFPFFALGYLSNEYGLVRYLQKKTFVIVNIILFLLLLILFQKEDYIYISGLSVMENGIRQLFVNCYRIFIGYLGIVSVIGITFCFFDKMPQHFKSFFALIGLNSMGLYCFQQEFVLPNVMPVINEYASPSLLWWLLGSAIILILSFVITILVKKIKPLNYLFLGGRR